MNDSIKRFSTGHRFCPVNLAPFRPWNVFSNHTPEIWQNSISYFRGECCEHHPLSIGKILRLHWINSRPTAQKPKAPFCDNSVSKLQITSLLHVWESKPTNSQPLVIAVSAYQMRLGPGGLTASVTIFPFEFLMMKGICCQEQRTKRLLIFIGTVKARKLWCSLGWSLSQYPLIALL